VSSACQSDNGQLTSTPVVPWPHSHSSRTLQTVVAPHMHGTCTMHHTCMAEMHTHLHTEHAMYWCTIVCYHRLSKHQQQCTSAFSATLSTRACTSALVHAPQHSCMHCIPSPHQPSPFGIHTPCAERASWKASRPMLSSGRRSALWLHRKCDKRWILCCNTLA
jgi:hypothetical protein